MQVVGVGIPSDLWSTRAGEVKAKVVAIHVRPGDQVREGQVVAEVEVDKAVIAIESHVNGRVVEVVAGVGDLVKPGDAIVLVEPIT